MIIKPLGRHRKLVVVEARFVHAWKSKRRTSHQGSGQLVFEPFACTAPATVAAIRNGWDWVCCERNSKNYDRGLERIEAALNEQKQSILFPTARKRPLVASQRADIKQLVEDSETLAAVAATGA
ncbi:MAG: hypothetical protein QM770_05085 [Tepidisphaeraceae bacterium]